MAETEFDLIPEDEEEEEANQLTGYPVNSAIDDELRRAWIVELLCCAPEGPVFDKLVEHAAAVEAYLIHGKPEQRPKLKAMK